MAKKKIITTVYKFGNGMVIVFDQDGNQMHSYQGSYDDGREKILAAAPAEALFCHAEWRKSRDIVKREDW